MSVTEAAAQQRHVRHNFIAHLAEGGIYMGSMALLNETTVLPKMVDSLGGPMWLTALVPVLSMVGFSLPPIFTAHLVERVRRFKPLCLTSGIVQRLPYLAAGLMLLLLADTRPTLVLVAVALMPLVSGLAGGTTLTAWQQLLIKTVPGRRRPAMIGGREVLSCVLGLVAGWLVHVILQRHEGPEGYGILCLITFGVMAVSYVLFMAIREEPHDVPPTHGRITLGENFRAIGGLIRADRQYAVYLGTVVTVCGMFVAVPFMAVHAVGVLHQSDSYVGGLLAAQMAGAIVGNVVAAHVGSRFGSRPMMAVARVALLAAIAWTALAADGVSFHAAFFLLGLGYYAHRVSNMTMALDICPAQRRSTYLAIASLVGMLSMLVATGVCALVRQTGGSFALTAGLAAAALAASLWFTLRLREPKP